MASYDVSAEIVITVLLSRQTDARNHVFAEREIERELASYRPGITDGVAYDVQVANVTATRRNQ